MKKTTKRMHILGAAIVLVLLVLAIGIAREAGYVLSGISIVKGGTLEIVNARPNSDVFIDNRQVGQVDENGNGVFDGLSLGERNVIVAANETWPWIFDFVSESGSTTTLMPLQVFDDTQGIPILEDAPEQELAESVFAQYELPQQTNPLQKSTYAVWVEGTTLLARNEAATEPRAVYSSTHPIRNVFWFGDRDDVVIVASQHNVFALDLRDSSVQNFQPIYTGSEPFAVAHPIDPTKIFIREGERYLLIDL